MASWKQHPPIQPPPPQMPPQMQAPPSAAPPAQASLPSALTAQWECKTFALDSDGKPAGELTKDLTVGAHFGLSCEGPPAMLKGAELRLELPKETPYSLRILETRNLGETKGEFVAVTWVAGEIKLSNPVLTDGSTRVGLGKIEISVKSVIDASKGEPQPFPPWGPLTLGWPIYIWLIFVALLGVLLSGLAMAGYSSIRRRRLKAMLAANAVPTTAYNHFNKEMRGFARRLPLSGVWQPTEAQSFVTDLDQAFRWYLTREMLLVNGLKGRTRAITAEVARAYPVVSRTLGKDLRLTVLELEKARRTQVSPVDASQLLELCRSIADRLEKILGESKGGA